MLTLRTNSMRYKDSTGKMQDVGAIIGDKTTDTSLSQSNVPADAKVVGDKINKISKDLSNEISVRKQEVAVERARINKFTTLAEGSTTGDAELEDARVDYTGKTWDNAGDHIRSVSNQLSEQIGDVKGTLTDFIGIEEIPMTSGYIYTNVDIGSVVDVEPVSHANFKYAIVPCSVGDCFTVNADGGGNPKAWAFTDENYVLLSASEYDVTVTDLLLEATSNGYLIINDCANMTSYKGIKKTDKYKDVYLRGGLNFNTESGVIEIPKQRILYDNEQYDLPSTNVLLDMEKTFGVLVFNIILKSFRVIYASNDKIEDAERIVSVFNVFSPKTAYVNGQFTVNGKLPNFKKVAFDLGADQNVGFENAINEWWIYPNAIRYTGIRDKSYLGYVDNRGKQGVIAYNHKTGHIERKVLRDSGEIDDHNNPAVFVNADGKVIVICTLHGSIPMHYIYVSQERESITYFDEYRIYMPDTEDKVNYVTYEQIIHCNNKYWMFFRVNRWNPSSATYNPEWYWAYRYSDDGITWSEPVYFLSADKQYYCIVRKYSDTELKIYMQYNESFAHEIRLGFLDCVRMNMLNADNSTVIQNLESNKTPITHTTFSSIISVDDDRFLRIYDIPDGTDMGVLYANRADLADYAETYYYKDGVSYKAPNQGNGFYGGTYSPGGAFVGTDEFVLCMNKSDKWSVEGYKFNGSDFDLVKTVLETPNANIKCMRPFKVVNGGVVAQRGYYMDYTNFETDLELNDY